MNGPVTLLGLRLRGRRVVAVGGGRVTARRVRDLLADGALVTVVAPVVDEELLALASESPAGRLTLLTREYSGPADLEGAWLVHTATGHPEVDRRVGIDAEAARIWCVDASDADRASAHVPARGELPLGDATLRVAVHGGGDPRRAAVARTAAVEHLSSGIVDLRSRRDRTGWVALVGAGPGDDGLLTRRAAALLASADVVVTDRLVPTSTLALLPPGVRVVDVGKQPNHHPVPQDEINEILVREAGAGRGVVRFKGGDPYVLGRGGEERLACEAAGIPVEVVPGISSAIAVPAAAGIPVTHRGLARGFTVVTGHEDLMRLPLGGDHTVVILMGVATLQRNVEFLLTGREESTPVAIVERGCTPTQRVTLGTLEDIVERAESAEVVNPAVIVVGDVVRLAHDWPREAPAPALDGALAGAGR
ncbi:uroporphyrinogen-III C-methyltransferase [Nostocoides sp. F2B08]|uniref:uroporphyrinogen-III C-methyltransferase n=1 Tax=Nostocoides sp. F2B08 TaxID=2653936 RepID=UPI0012635CEB|nr:uroporphyrinogen-III C-methyltransferase [Tetrasphaera sp. F2B08]KAB7746344.1 uroporphyrinogen-III C-methyltransferase [Tetrasphaera sp. F2B08]